MKHTAKRTSLLALGTLAIVMGVSPSAHAAALGIVSSPGSIVSLGVDTNDNIALQITTDTINQAVFSVTMYGGSTNVPSTTGFAYYTDTANIIRDVLYVNWIDTGGISTLYINYLAHGNYGTVSSPVGTLIDPKTSATISLASLPKITGVPISNTQVSGYITNADLKSTSTGGNPAFVPYLAVYLTATENTAATPEPSSLLMLGGGLAAVVVTSRKRMRI